MILLVSIILAALSVSLAYWIAGDIWARRHHIRYRVGKAERIASGALGEIFLLLCCAAILFMVERAATPNTIGSVIFDFDAPILWVVPYGAAFLIAAVAVSLYVFWHGVATSRKSAPEERATLLKTYLVYGVFSAILFSGGVVLILLLLKDVIFDFRAFEQRSAEVLRPIGDISGLDQAEIGRRLELLRLDGEVLLSTVEDSLRPILIFVAGIFAVNLAIRLTPLRTLYVNSAVFMTHIATGAAFLLIVVVGGWIYTSHYSSFIDDALAALEALRPALAGADADVLSRYADVTITFIDNKTLLGFLTRISTEWGAVAALLGLGQWMAEQFRREEAEESAADAEMAALARIAAECSDKE